MGFLSFNATSASAATKATNSISSKQAAEIVQKKYGGKVLKVKKQSNNGSYKVKMVTANGQVISKSVNSTTGMIEGSH